MEIEEALRIFNRSILKNNLRYTEFFGDSKSHASVGKCLRKN